MKKKSTENYCREETVIECFQNANCNTLCTTEPDLSNGQIIENNHCSTSDLTYNINLKCNITDADKSVEHMDCFNIISDDAK